MNSAAYFRKSNSAQALNDHIILTYKWPGRLFKHKADMLNCCQIKRGLNIISIKFGFNYLEQQTVMWGIHLWHSGTSILISIKSDILELLEKSKLRNCNLDLNVDWVWMNVAWVQDREGKSNTMLVFAFAWDFLTIRKI